MTSRMVGGPVVVTKLKDDGQAKALGIEVGDVFVVSPVAMERIFQFFGESGFKMKRTGVWLSLARFGNCSMLQSSLVSLLLEVANR